MTRGKGAGEGRRAGGEWPLEVPLQAPAWTLGSRYRHTLSAAIVLHGGSVQWPVAEQSTININAFICYHRKGFFKTNVFHEVLVHSQLRSEVTNIIVFFIVHHSAAITMRVCHRHLFMKYKIMHRRLSFAVATLSKLNRFMREIDPDQSADYIYRYAVINERAPNYHKNYNGWLCYRTSVISAECSARWGLVQLICSTLRYHYAVITGGWWRHPLTAANKFRVRESISSAR